MASGWRESTLRILIILNNHSSFGIVDLCIDLRQQDPSIVVDTVCTPEFALANRENFEKRGLAPRFLDPRAEFGGAERPSRTLSGVRVIEQNARSKQSSKGAIAWLKNFAIKQVLDSSAYALAREWRIVRRFRGRQKQALNLLAQLKPSVILSLTDRSHDYVEGPVLWATRKNRIPIVLPYVAQFDIDAAVAYRHGANGQPDPELCPFKPLSLYKLLTYRRLREQVYRNLFFQATYILNAASRVGILSSYPWWTGNGLSDVVCVDSRCTEEQYAKHRVPREKLVVLGHVQFDRIFLSHLQREDLRVSLIQQYQLDKQKALLILSMPQYAEQGYMPWPEHWCEIDKIIGNVSKAGQNLLLSIHPRSDISQYSYLEQRFNCRIVEQPLADIIGAADVFLASNSSTFVWSVLCGIPTVALKSPVQFLYKHLTTIRSVDESKDLADAISDLLSRKRVDFSHDWRLLGRDSVFDGRYAERFRALLDRNVDHHPDHAISH
jgi:hypothetical protein